MNIQNHLIYWLKYKCKISIWALKNSVKSTSNRNIISGFDFKMYIKKIKHESVGNGKSTTNRITWKFFNYISKMHTNESRVVLSSIWYPGEPRDESYMKILNDIWTNRFSLWTRLVVSNIHFFVWNYLKIWIWIFIIDLSKCQLSIIRWFYTKNDRGIWYFTKNFENDKNFHIKSITVLLKIKLKNRFEKIINNQFRHIGKFHIS